MMDALSQLKKLINGLENVFYLCSQKDDQICLIRTNFPSQDAKWTFFTADILTSYTRKSTCVINNLSHGCIPLCMLAH